MVANRLAKVSAANFTQFSQVEARGSNWPSALDFCWESGCLIIEKTSYLCENQQRECS